MPAARTPRTPLWRLADEKLDGRLADLLVELRGVGDTERSWAEVAAELYREHGLRVSHETLRQWWTQITGDGDPAATKASA